jgi:branched-chain amino acid transport system substrate-binding protein
MASDSFALRLTRYAAAAQTAARRGPLAPTDMHQAHTRLAAVAAAVFTLAIAACGDSDDDGSGDDSGTWRIGLEAPLSGDLQTLGEGMLNGAELAADQLNADGGLLGKEVEIVPVDDGGEAEIGVPAVQDAIEEGLDGVVGPYNSGVGVETLPLYQGAGLVPIRLTSDDDTEGFGFTLQPMASQIAPITAEALTDFIGASKVAITYDNTEEYTTGIAREVRNQLEGRDVEVTAFQQLQPGQEEYTGVVNKLAAGNPDAIYAAVYFPEGARIANAISPGSGPTCLLDYGAYDTGYVEDAGEAAPNCDVVGVPAPDDFADSEALVSEYEDRFDEAPGTWSPYTYDSVKVLAQAAEQAGGFDAEALTAALNEVKGFDGWTGSTTFEPGTGNREPATVTVDEVNDEGAFSVDGAWAKAVGAPY